MKRLPTLAWCTIGLVLGLALGGVTGWASSRPKLDKEGNRITIGRFRLRTFPKGAQVWIDGKLEVESTPATLIKEAGEYHLYILAEGAAEGMERVIEVEAGESTSLDLKIPAPPKATVTVLSDVEGAVVRINGYKRGETPLLRATTKPGPIDLTVTDPGGRARSEKHRLAIGEQKRFEIFFGEVASLPEEPEVKVNPLQCHPKEVGYLSIGLKPNGTVQTTKGETLGDTPLLDHEMKPGIYDLILRSKDGTRQKNVSIEVKANERSVYRFMLVEEDEVR